MGDGELGGGGIGSGTGRSAAPYPFVAPHGGETLHPDAGAPAFSTFGVFRRAAGSQSRYTAGRNCSL